MFQINPLFLEQGTISPTGEVKLTTPSIITTDKVRDQFAQNNETLVKMEAGLVSPPVQEVKEGETLPLAPVITLRSSNSATQNLVNQINQKLAEIRETLTPGTKSAIDKINDLEMDKNLAIADARTAADRKDAATLSESMAAVDETEKTQRELLEEFIKGQRELRETFVGALTPTERETELKRQLNTLRTERQLLPLELRKEGISAAGIQARQVEDERVRAIQEQNLLLELGLEQEVRTFAKATAEAQLGFLRDDFDLRLKIEDRLKKDEQDVVDRAQKLTTNSLNALENIVEQFEGLAWEDMDAETQADVINLLKPFPDLNVKLVSDALKNAKQNQIFERVKKTEESVVDVRQRRQDTADLLAQISTYESREEALADLIRLESSIRTRIGDDGFQKLQDEVDRVFPPPTEVEETEEKIEGGGAFGAVKGFFESLFRR